MFPILNKYVSQEQELSRNQAAQSQNAPTERVDNVKEKPLEEGECNESNDESTTNKYDRKKYPCRKERPTAYSPKSRQADYPAHRNNHERTKLQNQFKPTSNSNQICKPQYQQLLLQQPQLQQQPNHIMPMNRIRFPNSFPRSYQPPQSPQQMHQFTNNFSSQPPYAISQSNPHVRYPFPPRSIHMNRMQTSPNLYQPFPLQNQVYLRPPSSSQFDNAFNPQYFMPAQNNRLTYYPSNNTRCQKPYF
jgi:hypothetical protein